MAPGNGVVRVRLHSYETGRSAARAIRVVKHRRTCPLPALNVGQKNGVIVPLHDDLIFEPDPRYQRGSGRVLLNSWFVETEVPDAIPRLNLVDGARAVLEQAVGFG